MIAPIGRLTVFGLLNGGESQPGATIYPILAGEEKYE